MWKEQRTRIRLTFMKGPTSRHLIRCYGALLGSLLVLKQAKYGAATRRDEIIYNQMRLGSNVLLNGFRDSSGTSPVCVKCGSEVGPAHILRD